MGKSAVFLIGGTVALLVVTPAWAEEPQLDISPQTLEGPPSSPESQTSSRDEGTEGPQERPRRPGLVLESTLGVLGFAGNFRHVAPPACWLHGQLGYEVTRGIMVYVDGELGWTDTSESQEEANTYAMALWGFGGGVRGTLHTSERVTVYVQGDIGALTADVKHDELTVLGFRNAESINPAGGDGSGSSGTKWTGT